MYTQAKNVLTLACINQASTKCVKNDPQIRRLAKDAIGVIDGCIRFVWSCYHVIAFASVSVTRNSNSRPPCQPVDSCVPRNAVGLNRLIFSNGK